MLFNPVLTNVITVEAVKTNLSPTISPDTKIRHKLSVLISHVILAVAQRCRFVIRHTNAGASDLDKAYRPSRTYPSASKTSYT